MLLNSLKIAWRHLIKNRQFTYLNLLGLSTGIACVILIYLWVSDEMSVDKFHKKDSQLFQVMQNVPLADGGIMTSDHTPGLLAQSLLQEIPGVEDAAIIKFPDEDDNPTGILSFNGASIKGGELYVTNNFFKLFSFNLLEGNKDAVLSNQYNVLLSDRLAMKLFHTTQNCIGKSVSWDRGSDRSVNGTYIVSGIFEAPSSNSSLQFDILFTQELYAEKNRDQMNWHYNDMSTYVLLKKGVSVNQFNTSVGNLLKSKIKVSGSKSLAWIGTLFAQKFSNRYLHNHYENGVLTGGRIEYVKLFSIIAIFILVIACINFMNLSTAKATGRMKEIGIKKCVGARRSTLVFQYIIESTLMALLSLIIAIGLVQLLLPAFKTITGKELNLNFSPSLILSLAVITLVTGIISGSYPALYLSRFKPVLVLKGKLGASGSESWIRKGLVIFQFAVSIILIVSVLVIYMQMKLIQNKNLGYDKDNLIYFANEGNIQKGMQSFLAGIKKIPGVINASGVDGDLVGNHSGGGGVSWEGKREGMEFSGLDVDYNFVEMLNLEMKKGRSFSNQFSSEDSSVIFNEYAIAAMNLKDPVGKIVDMYGRKMKIIGVVKDFNFESLYKQVSPFFLRYSGENKNVLVKIKAGSEKQTLAALEKFYKSHNQGLPFEYKFMDEDYQKLYASEQRVAVLSRYFAGIALVISCLGLFGLAAFTAQKRQKEIGIRKIVGATVGGIAIMLSKDFLKLVLLAMLIAFPLSWWAINKWLDNFPYRVDIGIGIFAIAGIAIVVITVLTIGVQSVKAALVNPIKNLRTE